MTLLHALLPRAVPVRPGRVVRRFLEPDEVQAEERARRDREAMRAKSHAAQELAAVVEHVAKVDAKREAELAARRARYAKNRERERAQQAAYYRKNRRKIIKRVVANKRAKA